MFCTQIGMETRRALLELLTRVSHDRNGITIPFPHRDIHVKGKVS